MRLARGITFLGVLLLLGVLTAQPAVAQTGTIQGRVVDESTGEPIAGARIALVERFDPTERPGWHLPHRWCSNW